jgi:hypothetical protein
MRRVIPPVISAFSILASGCEPDHQPYGTIVLSSQSGTASHVIGGNHTFAFPHRDLAPPSMDPAGTKHTLSFTPPSQQMRRQEIIAFDLDYSEPIMQGPQPTIDYVPAPVNYVSVPAGTSKTYTFNLAPTAHVVRYWHGACAATTPWSEIFDALSAGLFKQIVEAATTLPLTSVERHYDVFQPHFIGAYSAIEHGFSFEAQYTFGASILSFS